MVDAETLKKLKDPFMAQFVDPSKTHDSLMKQNSGVSSLAGSTASGSTAAGKPFSGSPSSDILGENGQPSASLVVDGQLLNNIQVFNHL